MDVVLFVLFAGLQLALAGLGVFVSLKPQPPERHRGWIITFLLLAVLAIAVGVVQQVRSTHAQESLQGQLTDIKKKIVPPPTAEENAAAVVALQDKHAADNRQPSTSSRPNVQPTKPHPSHPKTPEVSPDPNSSQSPPTPQAETPVSPLSAARLTVSQSPSPDPSTRQDAPVKTRIVVQTDRDFPVLRLAVECDGPLVDGNASTAGVEGMSSMKMTSQGVVSGHPNIFVLTYQSATPPFGPSNPVILNLWSKNPVTCNRASTF